jgi:1-acyl-sn-glycerol-3-phosphate acyltransferase
MKTRFYRFVRFLLAFPARILLRVHVTGRENEPTQESGPYLVCANHQTALDVFFLCIAMKRQQPNFMAKASLFRIPILGFLIRQLGAYPVNRNGKDVGAVKHVIKLLENGRSVGIFPQGTRCAGKPLRECEVKAGAGLIAARAGVQVLPVYIGMKDQKWKLFRRVDVVVGEPIPFEQFGYDKEQAGEYARISNEVYERICVLGEQHNAKR